MSAQAIRVLFDYNYWANDRMFWHLMLHLVNHSHSTGAS